MLGFITSFPRGTCAQMRGACLIVCLNLQCNFSLTCCVGVPALLSLFNSSIFSRFLFVNVQKCF